MLHYADDINTQIVIISFHTLGWIQNLITTCWKLLPGTPILVVDNNPDIGELGYKSNREYIDRNPMVDAERYWLNLYKHKLTIIKQPNRDDLTHGHGMDLAMKWCLEHGIENMTHLEPDCSFQGVEWYTEQLEAIRQGMYVAGCVRVVWGTTDIHRAVERLPEAEQQKVIQKMPLHVCCSTYHLPPLKKLSFTVQDRNIDAEHPQYSDLVSDYYNMRDWGQPQKTLLWETGHKIWFEAAKINKAKQTRYRGLHHEWHSTAKDFWTNQKFPTP